MLTTRRRTFLAGLMAGLAGLPVGRVRADMEGARTFVREAGARTAAAANADQPLEQRVEALAAIMDDVTDIELIARLVLGKHWRSSSPGQRDAYLQAFRIYALDSLAYRFGRLGKIERFEIVESRPVDGRDTLVGTEIFLTSSRAPTRVDWRVRQQDGGYQIIDVVAEGVSMLITNRNEFDSVINREGFDSLIAQIQQKSTE